MQDSLTIKILEAAFHPRAIAVVGASPGSQSFGYHYVQHLLSYGYKGHVYPVHPRAENVLGLTAYPSLSAVPEPVDYLICCIPAAKVVDLLAECPDRGVKVVHLFTGRLAETGRQEALQLEMEILQQAHKLGIRLIGPNCTGLHYPREGISFNYDLSDEPGTVGGVFQSGGASGEFVRFGSLRGLRFSKVIGYGNALDLDESDLLDYLAQDSETKVIAAYFEGAKDGRKFLRSLRNAASTKPVIVLKGGRGISGTKASASHTSAVAGSINSWQIALKQAGAIPARSLNELIDLAVSFSLLPPIRGKRVGIAGGGGGKSVLSADECEEAGLHVVPLPEEIREELRSKAPLLWDWVGNPADRSIMVGASIDTGEMLKMMARTPHFDCLIANITEDNPFDKANWCALIEKETADFIEVASQWLKPIAAVMGEGALRPQQLQDWRWKLLAEQRSRLSAARIPLYSTVAQAARAINQLVDYYRERAEE